MSVPSHPISAPVRRWAVLVSSVFFFAGGGARANWDASPLVVHEWGVNTFDWDASERLEQKLPEFLYTDKKPGKLVDQREKRVRDLRADGGVRTKPILYFYPQPGGGRGGAKDAEVGIEMRFADGYANAWWPQVTHYRPESVVGDASAPDWEPWKAAMLKRYEGGIMGNKGDAGREARWKAELATYKKLDHDEQVQWLANRRGYFFRSNKMLKFPEDGRMQLVWDRLALHQEQPEGQTLPGADLPDDHWVKVAREVDAAYVSNGREAERYVFYEGKTREEPVIALLPADGGAQSPPWRPKVEEREVALVNSGKFPIHDVIAVYRDSKRGILWTGFISVLPALPPSSAQSDQVTALRIPDFSKPLPKDDLKVGEEEFGRRTTDRLLEHLTAGLHYQPGRVMGRDPADPQPPTRLHQLYRKEAVALEKIWHDDFFESEGLTVLYRESPAYLDEAMPLNIFTSMYWYVKLSRCGLVLNRNLPLDQVHATDEALDRFALAHWNPHLVEHLDNVRGQLQKNRFLTLGQIRYHYGRSGRGDALATLQEKLSKLFE